MKHLFSVPSFNCVGDPYGGSRPKSSRNYGRNFRTNPTMKGKTGTGVYFTKLKYKHSPYLDSLKVERIYQKRKAKRAHLGKKKRSLDKRPPFRPASPPTKMVGSGQVYGTFTTLEHHPIKSKSGSKVGKKKVVFKKRGFYTNPTRKGTNLWERKGIFRRYSEPNPHLSTYDVRRKHELERRSELQNQRPFIVSGKSRAYIDGSDIVDCPAVLKPQKVASSSSPSQQQQRKRRGRKRRSRSRSSSVRSTRPNSARLSRGGGSRQGRRPFYAGAKYVPARPRYVGEDYSAYYEVKYDRNRRRKSAIPWVPSNPSSSGPTDIPSRVTNF